MDSPARCACIRKALGCILSQPTFVADLLVQKQRNVHQLFEGILSDCIVAHFRDSIETSKKEEEVRLILNTLGSPPRQTESSTIPEVPSSSPIDSYTEKIGKMKSDLMDLVLSDLSMVLQVEIDDSEDLQRAYREGCTLVRKVNTLTTGSGSFRLLPTLLIGALWCACISSQRLRLYHKDTDDIVLLGSWVDNITRVWLHMLDGAVLKSNERDVSVGGELVADDWAEFVFGARHLFHIAKKYIHTQFLNPDVHSLSELDSVSYFTFEEVAFQDVNSMKGLLMSMQGVASNLLRKYRSFPGKPLQFEEMQMWQTMSELAIYIRHQSKSGSEDVDIEQMRHLVRGIRSLIGRCLNVGYDWQYHRLEDFELCFRSNNFNGNEIGSMHSHFLLNLSVALFLQSSAFVEVYRPYIEGLVIEVFEEELKA